MYFYNRVFSSALTLARTAEVTCEKCGCRYRYRLVRRGTASASAPYGIASGRAEERAKRRARAKAERLLAKGADPVACPDCGWFQADMVREAARRQWRWMWHVAGWLPLLAAVVLFVVLLDQTNGFEKPLSRLKPDVWPVVWGLAATVAVPPIVVPLLQAWLRRRTDLNQNYPARPDPVPGAPLAVRAGDTTAAAPAPVELLDDDPSTASLGYERRDPDVLPGGWVTVQLLGVVFPPACAVCLTPTTSVTTFQPRGQSLAGVNVPVCPACARRQVVRKTVAAAIGAVVGAAAGLPLVYTADARDQSSMWVTVVVLACIGGLIALGVAARRWRPLRMRRYSAERNTVQVRFRNGGYTDAFRAANRVAAARAVVGR